MLLNGLIFIEMLNMIDPYFEPRRICQRELCLKDNLLYYTKFKKKRVFRCDLYCIFFYVLAGGQFYIRHFKNILHRNFKG